MISVVRGAVRQTAKQAMAALLPARFLLVRGPPHGRSVCLTFDDGPDPRHTPAVLVALAEARAQATFFVIGQRAVAHPDVVARAAAAGHTVGSHSYFHRAPDRTPADALEDEVVRTRRILGRILGAAPNLFRPPRGELTPAKLLRLWRMRQVVVLWNRDPRDYACASEEELRNRVDRLELEPGDLLLLHDTNPHTPRVLPDLLARLHRLGLRAATVAEWI